MSLRETWFLWKVEFKRVGKTNECAGHSDWCTRTLKWSSRTNQTQLMQFWQKPWWARTLEMCARIILNFFRKLERSACTTQSCARTKLKKEWTNNISLWCARIILSLAESLVRPYHLRGTLTSNSLGKNTRFDFIFSRSLSHLIFSNKPWPSLTFSLFNLSRSGHVTSFPVISDYPLTGNFISFISFIYTTL